MKRMSDDQRMKLDGMHEVGILRETDTLRRADQIYRHDDCDHHGGGFVFRGDEHDVCGGGISWARDRHAAHLGILPAQHLTSFVLESLLFSLIGGMAAVLMMLPFNGLTTGTSN